MTKLQKQTQFVRNEFNKVMVADRWGHFKHNDYRIKMKKNLFRFEKKIGNHWLKLKSVYYKHADETNLNLIINHIFK